MSTGKTIALIKGIGGGSTGGGGLPSGGTPYQYLVTDGDGKTGWADRLAYKYLGEKIDFDIKEVSSGQFAFTREKELELLGTEGTVMLVTVGSTDYECRVAGFLYSGRQAYYCGNLYKFAELNGQDPSSLGLTQDTGEPFVIICIPLGTETEAVFLVFDSSASGTLKVAALVETIHPIPAEYLPVDKILFTYDGTNYTCNVSFEKFAKAAYTGANIMLASTGDDMEYSYYAVVLRKRARGERFDIKFGSGDLSKGVTYLADGTIQDTPME